LCGLCAAAGQPAAPFAEGGTMGSLTMTSYALGCAVPPARGEGSASMPPPGEVPPEQTNI
jgi:4,5-DOPA dioxygenase extradiol